MTSVLFCDTIISSILLEFKKVLLVFILILLEVFVKKNQNGAVKVEKLKNSEIFYPDDVTLYYCGIDKDLKPGAR